VDRLGLGRRIAVAADHEEHSSQGGYERDHLTEFRPSQHPGLDQNTDDTTRDEQQWAGQPPLRYDRPEQQAHAGDCHRPRHRLEEAAGHPTHGIRSTDHPRGGGGHEG
jgi:hypothetical protein